MQIKLGNRHLGHSNEGDSMSFDGKDVDLTVCLTNNCTKNRMGAKHDQNVQRVCLQCATDTRLWLYGALKDVRLSLADLIKAAVARAEAEVDVVMPGFTHLQPAMTVTSFPRPSAFCSVYNSKLG